MSFNDRKVGQVAAYLMLKSDGAIELLKLVKLIYLSDRKFLELYDSLITDDKFVSMPHGPVNTATLNCMNGAYMELTGWNEFVSDRENHMLALAKKISNSSELDLLSVAEFEVMDSVWEEHGAKTKWQLVKWTHDNCKEWEDPEGSSIPIKYETLLSVLGKKDTQRLSKQIVEESEFSIPA